MASAAFIGLLLGLLVGLRFKVLALVPMELAGFFLALIYGTACHSFSPALAAFAVGSLALQFGYLVAVFGLRRLNVIGHPLPRPH